MVRPQIIATDLDGTSLCDNVRMSERTFRMFERAQAAGIEIVIVTGRSVCYLREMELPHCHYAICSNGVVVMDMRLNRAVYKNYFTPEEALTAWKIIRGRGAYVELSVENDVIVEERDFARYAGHPLLPFMKDYYAKGKIHVVPSLDSFIRDHLDQIEKFTMLRSGQEITEAIRKDLNETGLFETRAGYEVDVMAIPRRTNKGTALLALADQLGVPHEAVYAFGDGKNDIAMLRAAGCGVAMGNAPDFVKEEADRVCGRCDEDGIVEFMEKNFGI